MTKLERLKELEGETRFLADSIDRRDEKIRALDSKLHAHATVLSAARVALELAKRNHNRRFAKTVDEIETLPTPYDSAIHQIDAVLPKQVKHEDQKLWRISLSDT